MKTATVGAMLAAIFLLCVARAQTQKDGGSAAGTTGASLPATLDWMARTYSFTEAEVHSTGVTLHKRETDASLTHQGCRLTLREKEVTFDSSAPGRTDTSKWRKVIDLATVDRNSIQLRPSSGGGKPAYFALEFGTIGGYRSVELFFDDQPRPATSSHGLILLFADHDGYALRFTEAFCRAAELCAEGQADSDEKK